MAVEGGEGETVGGAQVAGGEFLEEIGAGELWMGAEELSSASAASGEIARLWARSPRGVGVMAGRPPFL